MNDSFKWDGKILSDQIQELNSEKKELEEKLASLNDITQKIAGIWRGEEYEKAAAVFSQTKSDLQSAIGSTNEQIRYLEEKNVNFSNIRMSF